MFHISKATSVVSVLRGLPSHLGPAARCCALGVRNYADSPKNVNKTVLVKVAGDARARGGVRARLVRAGDVPRVLRYVREHARVWPGPLAPRTSLVLADLVARSLAQGHSIVAEQQGGGGGGRPVGLALGAALCRWDAALLERWAPCVRCSRSRRLLHFAAHCLRAPMLHHKYQVDTILQVILIVPAGARSAEVVQLLARRAVQRCVDAGFPLLRFDATEDYISNNLEELPLKKEWSLSYHILPQARADTADGAAPHSTRDGRHKDNSGKIIVYSALINSDGGPSKNTTGRNPDAT